MSDWLPLQRSKQMSWFEYIVWRGGEDILFPVIIFLLVAYGAMFVVGLISYLWRVLK